MNIICFSADALECITVIPFCLICSFVNCAHYRGTIISYFLGEKKSNKKIDLTNVSCMHHHLASNMLCFELAEWHILGNMVMSALVVTINFLTFGLAEISSSIYYWNMFIANLNLKEGCLEASVL